MAWRYELFYLFRVVPWDRPWTADALRALLEGPQALPAGRALDLGCGLGRNAIYLARQGWQVTGVDAVGRALRTARRRAAAKGVQPDFVQGDVTRLAACGVTGPYQLLLDSGCFHAMTEAERARYGASIGAVAAPGATLLVSGFPPGWRGPGPRGMDAAELERRLGPDWRLTDSGTLTESAHARVLGLVWYRLQRHGPAGAAGSSDD